jgi:hypothetical protein
VSYKLEQPLGHSITGPFVKHGAREHHGPPFGLLRCVRWLTLREKGGGLLKVSDSLVCPTRLWITLSKNLVISNSNYRVFFIVESLRRAKTLGI